MKQSEIPALSQSLIKLAAEDLPSPRDKALYLEVLRFAMLAWNLAVLPPESDEAKIINNGLLRMPAGTGRQTHARLMQWVVRKNEMFPNDRRLVADVRLKDLPEGFSVVAYSTAARDSRK